MRRVVPIFSFAVFCASLSGCQQGVSRDVTATVLSARGQVVYGWEGRNDLRPIGHETKLGVGNVVRTSDEARLDLALLPGALVQVSSDAEVKIEELRMSKDGNETADAMRNRSARIRLNRGKITVLFVRKGETPSQFVISTQQAAVTADSDCLFCIQTDGTRTRLTCVQGRVDAAQSDRTRRAIDAGYFQEWPSDRSAAISAVDDARGQIDIGDTLEAERELQQLQSKQQLRRPF